MSGHLERDFPELNASDEMTRRMLAEGARPAEIAVRLGISMAEARARIDRLQQDAQQLPSASPVPLPAPLPATPAQSPAAPEPPPSAVPAVLLGVLALAFVVGLAGYIIRESGSPTERANADRGGRSVPPAIVQPTPTQVLTIDGVVLDEVSLGAPADLPPNVAITVRDLCDQCQRLVTYVQGPLGLESYPVDFDLPAEARIFGASATEDGGTVIASVGWDDGGASFRSDDGGVSWVEVWRGDHGRGVARLGPAHVALSHFDTPDELLIVPGGVRVFLDDPRLDELTPLYVGLTIVPPPAPGPETLPRAWAPDRTHYVTNLLPEDPEPRQIMLGVFEASGNLVRGWSGPAVLPVGAITAGKVVLSAVLTASGELAEDPDDPTYLRVSLFDLDTGTIQPLKLPETPPIPNQFVVSVREGPFLRVTSAASPCLELRVDPGKGEATGACAVPNVLLRDLGSRVVTASEDWALVAMPGGAAGWVALSGVIPLPRR